MFYDNINRMFYFLQRYFSGDSKIPVLIVGNKADMTAVRQDYILQPEAFCAKHRVCNVLYFLMVYIISKFSAPTTAIGIMWIQY